MILQSSPETLALLDSGAVDFICDPDLPHFKITLQSNNQFYTYISIGFIMMLVFHIF